MNVDDIWREMQEKNRSSAKQRNHLTSSCTDDDSLSCYQSKGKHQKFNETVAKTTNNLQISVRKEKFTVSQLKLMLEDCSEKKRNAVKRVFHYLNCSYSSEKHDETDVSDEMRRECTEVLQELGKNVC